MDGPGGERRLAAILAADVVDYSRHLGADEAGTLERLRTMRREVVDPLMTEHRGRVFKTMGDGLLAEFSSAVAALRCAIAIQERLRAEASTLRLRIGLHQGDIVIEGDDLLGDGVNIAARIQPLAEPGGICISARVREDAAGKLALDVEDMGEPDLKNIARKVRIFRVRLATEPRPPLALPDRPSLAVLPFTNLSGDPEQEYFADGVVEDIITALSRVGWFFVIARNSSFTYKGRAVDIKQVGRELGVRYVLEGSVRKAGGRIRISGQLIDAATSHHVWADHFDGDLADVFDLQDRITESVVGAIEPSLRTAEIGRARAKPTESLDAYDLYLRALPHFDSRTRDGNDQALVLLNRAIAIDATYALARAALALAYLQRSVQGWAEPGETPAAIALARAAVTASPDDPATLRCAGHALASLAGEYDQSLVLLQRAARLNPNSADIAATTGYLQYYVGQPARAAESFQRAIRLSPLDPRMLQIFAGLGMASLMAGENDEALNFLQSSINAGPDWAPTLRALIFAFVRLGRIEEARETARRLLEVDPGYRIGTGHLTAPKGAFRDEFVSALRLAGLPD
ncbi:MAG: adenylate/guanylate cyclase domain-containing protein [Acetobacteraceae bacterium]